MRKRPSARADRLVAMAVWLVFGLLVGLALGIFTGHGWLYLGIGFLLGVLLAFWRTKPSQQIEED